VNPEERDSRLSTATAAARRLLVHAIDVRFALDEATEAIDGGAGPTLEEVRRMRADLRALQQEIDCLHDALWAPPRGGRGVSEEADDELVKDLRA
jgi:hypothetical protein